MASAKAKGKSVRIRRVYIRPLPCLLRCCHFLSQSKHRPHRTDQQATRLQRPHGFRHSCLTFQSSEFAAASYTFISPQLVPQSPPPVRATTYLTNFHQKLPAIRRVSVTQVISNDCHPSPPPGRHGLQRHNRHRRPRHQNLPKCQVRRPMPDGQWQPYLRGWWPSQSCRGRL